MKDPIEYELEIPRGKAGRALVKAFKRVLKRAFGAERITVRSDVRADVLSAVVEREKLGAIRNALEMVKRSKGLAGPTIKGDVEAPAPSGRVA